MRWQIRLVFVLVLTLSLPAFAAEVPPALQDWEPWVLHGQEDQACPFAYNNWQDRRCVWPSDLDLKLDGTGGRFMMKVKIYRESWAQIPGDERIWPQDVSVADQPWPVTDFRSRPSVLLLPGDYEIRGTFAWESLPDSLLLPPGVGLVRLALMGKSVDFPDIRGEKLWLKKQGPEAAAEEDRVEVKVYRMVIDDVPMRITTRLELDVAGGQREEVLGPVLPMMEGGRFIPLGIISPLPARLDDDGVLHLQARPGHWVVQVHARSTGAVASLPVPGPGSPWPAEEVWVFESRPALRLVEPGGLSSLDPRQTGLPEQWQELPAFLGKPGETLTLRTLRRGDVDPAPDNLSVTRDMWLDFDGKGFTVQDRITGTMSRTHRLEAGEDLMLGRVAVNGENRLITSRTGSPLHGVEVRRGRIEAQVESRMEGTVYRLPATGWTHDFQTVSTRLKVPPGWDILAVLGTDNRPGTWLQRWTLLDLFIVLIVSVSLFRIFGPTAGIAALVTLGLTWHAPFAPRYIWLHLLIASALVRYLPKGRVLQWAKGYRIAALVVFTFIVIPFTIDQVRTAIFPQLEYSGVIHGLTGSTMGKQAVVPQILYQEDGEVPKGAAKSEPAPTQGRIRSLEVKSGYQYLDSFGPRFDQTANVQTGPGLPDWQWKNVNLSWNGPVKADQGLRIVWVPPFANSIVRIVRVFLVFFLGLLFAGVRLPIPGKAAGAVMIILALGIPQTARADGFPTPELLRELQARLLEPARCLPGCAEVNRMSLEADPGVLRLRMELHVLEDTAVPLPGVTSQWLPETIQVDGVAAKALLRDDQGTMWISVGKGLHQVLLEGSLPRRSTVQIPLKLPPRRVTSRVSGWTLDGVHENGVADEQLQLTRITRGDESAAQNFESPSLPPFVVVERNLVLGLEWRTRTVVRRSSPAGSAVLLEVPLLPGESVITDGIRVAEGKVMVNLGPGESTITWDSALDRRGDIRLFAPDTTHWTELWRAEISPIWHMEQTGGITVVHKPDPEGEWAPEWRPWPGEEVRLGITRPEAIAGSTLTIDSSLITVNPGKRATDAQLAFRARSSLGGQHVITLPEGVELISVKVDGRLQPIRQEEGKLTLPIHPGKQTFEIAWRSAHGMENWFITPVVDLGIPSVNHGIHARVPRARWILFTGGPRLGPAVLFWGALLVVLLLSIGLGRTGLTPLKWWHWGLLGVGLTQASLPGAFIIVLWLFALGLRRRLTEETNANWHNLAQAGLALLTIAAFMSLIGAVQQGLLGFPSMQIMGNGSYGNQLQWFADRVGPETARAWILSVPLFAYRLLMLAWALWLASALIGWIKWGWESISIGGYWKQTPEFIILPQRKKKKEEGDGELMIED